MAGYSSQQGCPLITSANSAAACHPPLNAAQCRSVPQMPTALCPWASQSMWCWLPACLHAR